MKYLCKTEEYQSPIEGQGFFKNPWVETGKKMIDDTAGRQMFKVDFHLKYLNGEKEIILESVEAIFSERQETFILNDEGEEIEILAFLMTGGTYHKSKIVHWGRPSFLGVQPYFDVNTIWGDIQITAEQPLATIARDWIDANVRIHGVPICENFELQL
jgi:hypothetical protein